MSEAAFEPGRATALARLQSFLPRAGRAYTERRSFDFSAQPGLPARDNVSMLSPYVRHRLLLEPEIITAVACSHRPPVSEKFIQEVCWRTYWKGWLEHRPALWSRYLDELTEARAALGRDGSLADRYQAAVEGRTGIGCFDAWARALVADGYLHNHARMWTASIWIFTLKLPWVLGADWFLRHLLDGDPASNTLSWRWVGGLHTRGKHYVARAANIAEYTGGRFDPRGELDEQASPLPPDEPVVLQSLRPTVPVDAGRISGLLITGDDALPESLGLELPVVTAVCVDTRADLSPSPAGEPARCFTAGALADVQQRASHAFGCTVTSVDPPTDRQLAAQVAAIVHWAQSHRLGQVVTAWGCVGPVRALLDASRPALAERGIALVELRRPWDAAVWPHATRGYFALRGHIPQLIQPLIRDCAIL